MPTVAPSSTRVFVNLRRAMNASLMSATRRFPPVAVLFALSCVPLLLSGYGADPDAWRVAYTAERLWSTDEYHMSRPPGYPLHELVMTVLVPVGGSFLANAATLAVAVLTLFVWAKIGDRYARHPAVLLPALAFAPGFWENAASTMDYHWSLLFLLLSLLFSLRVRPIIAGVLLALALGFRPANVVALLPLALPFLGSEQPARLVVQFVCSTMLCALVIFSPLVLHYGATQYLEILHTQASLFHPTWPERFLYFAYRSIYAVGPLAVCVAAVLLFQGREQLREYLRRRHAVALVSFAFVITFLSFFVLFPIEREYLIPALPFLLLLVDTAASKNALYAFALALVSFSLVNPDVVRHEGVRGRPGFNLREGAYVEELQRRSELAYRRMQLASLPVSGRCIVMAGSSQSMWFENDAFALDATKPLPDIADPTAHYKWNPDAHVVDALEVGQIQRALACGYRVYCFAPAAAYLESLVGRPLSELGVEVLRP